MQRYIYFTNKKKKSYKKDVLEILEKILEKTIGKQV